MKQLLFSVALLGVAAVPLACSRPGSDQESKVSAKADAKQLQIVKPEKRAVTRVVSQPGTVQAFEETSLYPKLPGYVGTIANELDGDNNTGRQLDIGSRVKKGQLLVHLEVPELEKEWKQKLALIKQSEAEVLQSEKAYEAADKGLAAAEAFVVEAEAAIARTDALFDRWQSEVARITQLVGSGVIDAQTQDETENQFKAAQATRSEAQARVVSAKATVKKAEADLGKASADITAAKAQLEVAVSEAERVESLVGYTKLVAPFDGVITHRAVNTGDLVSANNKEPLFRIAKLDPVRLIVHIPEADAGLVNTGMEMTVTLPTSSNAEVAGKVTRTSWSLQPSSRTLRVEIDAPNDDERIRPGMYVYAKLKAELPADWTVPAEAIVKISDLPMMYLVRDGKAERVAVDLGRGDNNFTQVIRYKRLDEHDWQPLSGDESIVVPATAVQPGQSVSQGD